MPPDSSRGYFLAYSASSTRRSMSVQRLWRLALSTFWISMGSITFFSTVRQGISRSFCGMQEL